MVHIDQNDETLHERRIKESSDKKPILDIIHRLGQSVILYGVGSSSTVVRHDRPGHAPPAELEYDLAGDTAHTYITRS
jgi:hypothetical protein